MDGSTQLSSLRRQSTIRELQHETFDCVIIGAGITGAGIAREAVRRGLSAALIEKDDFSAGTSSRSTKMIHGGLRYLAMGEVALVRETARERKHVNRMAPHLAEPCWMVVPARSRATLTKFRTGLTLYEKLGAVSKADLHRNWSGQTLADQFPLLDRKTYPYACAYREYLTDDSRLVIANVRDAAARGAVVGNYLEVTGLATRQRKIRGVRCRCSQSGEEFVVEARTVVNAAGPWVEMVCRMDESPVLGTKQTLHLAKGIHISLPRDKLPVDHLLVMNTRDGRNIFTIPRGDVVFIGTTDNTFHAAPTLWPSVERQEVDYLLQPLTDYFAMAPLGAADCIAAWAGLRPLVEQPGKSSKEISRKEEIWLSEAGLISIAGGKLTGYRLMGIEAVDQVCEVLARDLPATDDLPPLPGGDFSQSLLELSQLLQQSSNLDAAACDRLVRLYGTEASDIVNLSTQPVLPGSSLIQGEVAWAVTMEAACTVADVVYRRTRAALYSTERCEIVEPIAKQMATLLGWNAERTDREIAHTNRLLAADLEFQHTP
ncbi:MAG: glycerol-3-phosphate dehydrogenase/oxidase [Pseudomonadales bacterium]|jgi:glycerol-3-phosphate dehydrogenase|nr:glycerol-3-phosphate dehydrogenase/oxidase [Pseudomonadales bacterium]MDP7360870.1 glycerol-3-phosphate dehydrogenase/oxidase [Pseudomonadales bacterium]MDP7594064.1 glycerol-3-phosphate dehydrogenase/oxidase [Pseudomonadales bacterium]